MGVQFYRDKDLPYFELKQCDTSQLSYKKHAHEEYSLGIVDKGKSSFGMKENLKRYHLEQLFLYHLI